MSILSNRFGHIQKKDAWAWIAFIISVVLFGFINAKNIFLGNFPFWYDPARDLLLARDNVKDITLIGPTTGIPGVFYGPYWIWLLSGAFLVSPDPRVITFLALWVPYLVVLPMVFWLFYRYGKISPFAVLVTWVLFSAQFGRGYATQLWNPHLAPLLLFILIYLVSIVYPNAKRTLFILAAMGFITGLMVNIHMSFGITLVVALYGYILWLQKENKGSLREAVLKAGALTGGLAVAFVPFLVFEVKHAFLQSKVLLSALTGLGGGLVTVKGLTDLQILTEMVKKFDAAVSIVPFAGFALIGISAFLYIKKAQQAALPQQHRYLVLFSICVLAAALSVYLLARNPVWNYHFLALEVPIFTILMVFLTQVKFAKVTFGFFALFYLLSYGYGAVAGSNANPLAFPNYVTKAYTVDQIKADAAHNAYTVYAYNPSIYTYDYSYLFWLKADKQFSYDPGQITKEGSIVYLILPAGDKAKTTDFINFRTPPDKYKTTKTWEIPDGTQILKREELR